MGCRDPSAAENRTAHGPSDTRGTIGMGLAQASSTVTPRNPYPILAAAALQLSCTANLGGEHPTSKSLNDWRKHKPIDLTVQLETSNRFELSCIYRGANKNAYAIPVTFAVENEKETRYVLRYQRTDQIGVGYFKEKPKTGDPCLGIKEAQGPTAFKAKVTKDWVEVSGILFFHRQFKHDLPTPNGVSKNAQQLRDHLPPPANPTNMQERDALRWYSDPQNIQAWEEKTSADIKKTLRRYLLTLMIWNFFDIYPNRPKTNENGELDLYLIKAMVKSSEGMKRDLYDTMAYLYHVEGRGISDMNNLVMERCEVTRTRELYTPQSTVNALCAKPFTRATYLRRYKHELGAVVGYILRQWNEGKDPVEEFTNNRPKKQEPIEPPKKKAKEKKPPPLDPKAEQYTLQLMEDFSRYLELPWAEREAAWAQEHLTIQDCLFEYFDEYDICMKKRGNAVSCRQKTESLLAQCVHEAYQ